MTAITYNVWHGRQARGTVRLAGEPAERTERRRRIQVEALAALAPDLLLLQEVDPLPTAARRFAAGLAMDELHLTVNCGIHLGPVKLPVNLNEGLAILARPELGLEPVAELALSGRDRCWGDRWGLQLAESRAALVARATLGGRSILVVNTHLHNQPHLSPDLVARLDRLVAAGRLAPVGREEIVAEVARRRARTLSEARRLRRMLAALRRANGGAPVLLGGDLNAKPGGAVWQALRAAGLVDPVGDAPTPATWDRTADPRADPISVHPSLPTFGIRELVELALEAARHPRRIDYLLTTGELEATSPRRVLDRPVDGLLPSDHFAVAAEIAPRP